MKERTTYPDTKRRYMMPLLFLLTGAVICAVFGFTGNGNFELAKQQILLRNIGHEILLHAGDSTSRVLPVQEIAPHEYQVRFENEFTFQTDSLVKIIRRSLEKGHLAEDYIVTVLNCSGKEILFGYVIFREQQKTIVPCLGRKQPRGCYLVNIRLQNTGIAPISNGYLVGGLSVFAFIGLLAVRPFRIRRSRIGTTDTNADVLQVGHTLFEPGKRQITISGITTELTPKENKLLKIFADSPGELIERHRLQKEIWEDEGVIVGRSLDVFISKLRKKLEGDASIQVANVHGKGYRLQINDTIISDKG
ncbi:MAG: Transcriptional regulatory protein terminal [Chitinophagaceae bacterium]|nr:Transcriptional regulatory protein terminal [Chitinophagaceae bacterium]